jgi:hypothetical protein
MTDATPEQIVAFLTGVRPMTDYRDRIRNLRSPVDVNQLAMDAVEAVNEVERLTADRVKMALAYDKLRAEVERLLGHKEEADRHVATIAELRAEVAEWRERYEAEHRDHLATIKHADALEDE